MSSADALRHAWVLHRRRYRESSLIVEFLTAGDGRIAAVARGALRPRSSLGNVLQPLVPLGISWRGRGELHTLIRAEARGRTIGASGERLYAVFYLNELLLRLTVPGDPVPGLFELYAGTLHELELAARPEPALRRFECGLLERIGLGLNLVADVLSGEPIRPQQRYHYAADHGASAAGHGAAPQGIEVMACTPLPLANGDFDDEAVIRDSKRLMRYVIDHHLEGRPLRTRELFATKRRPKQ